MKSDLVKNVVIGLLTAAALGAGASAIQMRDDVRDMKKDMESAAKLSQIEIAEIRLGALNDRVGDLLRRVDKLEDK